MRKAEAARLSCRLIRRLIAAGAYTCHWAQLEVLKDELKLSSAELTVMQAVNRSRLIMEDEQVTVGINLNDKTGTESTKATVRSGKEKLLKREGTNTPQVKWLLGYGR